MGKISLYFHTMKQMKSSQVFHRLKKKLGRSCSLGVSVSDSFSQVRPLESIACLDFDEACLARFPVDELMRNQVSFLHSAKSFDWKSEWNFDDKSPLWNFNLHYFEFLFSLVAAYRTTGEKQYLDKTVEIISGWIEMNPEGTQPAWASYTIALRIVAWIIYYGYCKAALPEDFRKRFLQSLHAQYRYLSNHLEKDILGNHYFEDLKSLVFGALFFQDEVFFQKALTEFRAECREEILPDGMHFELSPMYHKIIFEGMLRVAEALRHTGRPDREIEAYLQPMLDVAYSFESGLDRVPLFNDGGNNVAKSLDALTAAAKTHFGLTPHFKGKLEASGYYIFEKKANGSDWKLVIDAGQLGPKYIPGHTHCDALSYELFRDGKPVVVNCGTYAYQCKERGFFRSTAAHNTVRLNGKEQSQCWGNFRLAKRSRVSVLQASENGITVEMTDAYGARCKREFRIDDACIEITDSAAQALLEVFVHPLPGAKVQCSAALTEIRQPYAPDYGIKEDIVCYRYQAKERIVHRINF